MHPRKGTVHQHSQRQGSEHNRGNDSQQIKQRGRQHPIKHRIDAQALQIGQAYKTKRFGDIKTRLSEGHHQSHQRWHQHRQAEKN